MLVSAFITHKKAERYADCQDRFSVNPDTKSIAVSDGMSQSIFQKYWADILVRRYTSDKDWTPDLESVRKLSDQWKDKVNQYLENEKQAGRNPWRAESSLKMGLSAGATIVGIRYKNRNELTCHVLGDSCLIHIRENKIQDIISSEKDVKSFDNYPDYYDSNPKNNGKGELRTETVNLNPNDIILLVSDPFSDFLLKKRGTKEESDLVKHLANVKTHNNFELIVAEWRNKGMHNDDSTLVIIKTDEADDLKLSDNNVDKIEDLIEKEKEEVYDSKENADPPTVPDAGHNNETGTPNLCKNTSFDLKNCANKIVLFFSIFIDKFFSFIDKFINFQK